MLLGGFADLHIATLDDSELAEFEQLIELPDPDLYAAFCEKTPLPTEYADGIFLRIKAFGTAGQTL